MSCGGCERARAYLPRRVAQALREVERHVQRARKRRAAKIMAEDIARLPFTVHKREPKMGSAPKQPAAPAP